MSWIWRNWRKNARGNVVNPVLELASALTQRNRRFATIQISYRHLKETANSAFTDSGKQHSLGVDHNNIAEGVWSQRSIDSWHGSIAANCDMKIMSATLDAISILPRFKLKCTRAFSPIAYAKKGEAHTLGRCHGVLCQTNKDGRSEPLH